MFASNVFSDVSGRFDLIISNPPFHDGLQTSLDAAHTLIRGAVKHLNSGGELRIVANAFLPYPQVLDETFGNHEVLAQTGRFKVYRAVYGAARSVSVKSAMRRGKRCFCSSRFTVAKYVDAMSKISKMRLRG